MKVVGSFNNVSEELRNELIKQIKPGELARFQLLHGSFDPVLRREVFGAAKSIRLNDRIYDPYQKDSKGKVVGGYVDIGVPDTIRENRVEKCKKYWVESIANGIPGNGQFALMGGNVNEMEIYEFLCLSNGNKDNPHRDKSKLPQYEIVDVEQIRRTQEERDYKELAARIKLLSKQNPEKAAELSRLIPKNEEAVA